MAHMVEAAGHSLDREDYAMVQESAGHAGLDDGSAWDSLLLSPTVCDVFMEPATVTTDLQCSQLNIDLPTLLADSNYPLDSAADGGRRWEEEGRSI